MASNALIQALEQNPQLAEKGTELAHAIHDAVMKGGLPARKIADFLHGTWLGHPLHAVLTDVTVGAWTIGMLFDAIAAVTDDDRARWVADAVTAVGAFSAVPTAMAGLVDYSTTQKPAVPTATLHGVMNDVNIVLYFLSVWQRKKGNRGVGVLLSTTAYALGMASAWLGGHLVYEHRVGVDNSGRPEAPKKWTEVAEESALEDGATLCVPVGEGKVLLYREGKTVHAIDAQCSHAGGPLEEGEVRNGSVQCPWHDSVFDLRSGSVVHGPATRPQARYGARIRAGKVEIRNEG